MFMFNDAISAQGLTEIPLQGKKYAWSNMQTPPMLEKLDWVFTSNSWTTSYPETTVTGLIREPSDHCPCLVSVPAAIPKGKMFRFKIYLLDCEGFNEIVQDCWSRYYPRQDTTKLITVKLKKSKKQNQRVAGKSL